MLLPFVHIQIQCLFVFKYNKVSSAMIIMTSILIDINKASIYHENIYLIDNIS